MPGTSHPLLHLAFVLLPIPARCSLDLILPPVTQKLGAFHKDVVDLFFSSQVNVVVVVRLVSTIILPTGGAELVSR